jgi:hypothetical protein
LLVLSKACSVAIHPFGPGTGRAGCVWTSESRVPVAEAYGWASGGRRARRSVAHAMSAKLAAIRDLLETASSCLAGSRRAGSAKRSVRRRRCPTRASPLVRRMRSVIAGAPPGIDLFDAAAEPESGERGE